MRQELRAAPFGTERTTSATDTTRSAECALGQQSAYEDLDAGADRRRMRCGRTAWACS
ncbi:hypothetical protein ACWD1Y_03520 [Streptomyces sp. NPDC002814]